MPKKKSKFKRDWSVINQKIKDRKKKFKDDDRMYKVKYNENGTSKVVMRFLPPIDENAMPFAEQHRHFFNDSDGWFVENCPQTIGGACPVCDDLRKNDYYNKDNDLYLDRKKQIGFFTNVLIIEDKNTPANEGKVFIYKFGTKIMEKVEDLIEDDLSAWDEECGVNFTLSAKRKKNSKMGSYDASKFSDSETSLDDYGDIDAILALRYDLSEFESESSYKSYDELKARYLVVTGEVETTSSTTRRSRKPVNDEDEDDINETVIEEEDDDIGDSTMYDSSDDDDDFFDDLVDSDDD